ncbi:ArsR/SmtB family transcription factor [Populibacterium corticicola]|uniref:ArsR/SmtB family transcription factor n=1 Tax=Populibacterium corticicola TaxID=1812826 RepID=A0ABW5XDN6_9MICO
MTEKTVQAAPTINEDTNAPALDALTAIHESIPSASTVSHMADVFSLLGDPGRIRILTALLNGPLKVRDIAAVTHQSQSSASHSLRLLRAHHVVSATKKGRESFYELEDQHVRSLLELTLAHVNHEGHTH